MSRVNDKRKSGEILGLCLYPPNSELKALQEHGARLVSVWWSQTMCVLWKSPGKGDETQGPAKPKPLVEIHSLRDGDRRLRPLYPKAYIICQMLAKKA